MESANDGVSAPPPSSPQDEHNSESSQLSPNHHQSSSQADQALLTQLLPTSGNADNYCNTQSSMPLESQCSQLMLATQPTYYNDSMLQTQFSNCNDHDNYAAKSQYSQQLLPATQPANTQNYGYTDELSVQDESSQLNTQDNSSQLEHLSMTQQQQQALLLTQQQQQQCDSNKLPPANGGEPEYGQSAKQSDEHDNDDIIMSSQEQRTNDQVEFLYNTQQNNEQEDSSDDDDDDDDDMERLVEEQNLAVSLSMEVIEESQRSRDNDARSRNVLYDVSNNVADNNDEDDELQTNQLTMRDDTVTDVSVTGFGFSSAGSGKAIAVNEEEMAKANKLLADDTQQKSSSDHDYDEQDKTYNPPSSGFGFSSAGSGKAIAVNEEEMAKANKLLVDDTQQKSSSDYAYDEQDEPYNPPSSGFGFSSAGSGKAIAVNEDEMAKANKLLTDDTQQKSSNGHDYDEQDESYNPPSGFGFSSAGSGKAIAVNEEEMAKANELLADDDEKVNDTTNATTASAFSTSKMTPKYQQRQQTNPTTTVANPYARKRSIDQISNGGAGKPNAATTTATPATLAAPTPSRKLVFNPYAKTVQSTTKTVLRNPYAKASTAAAAPTDPSIDIPPPSRPMKFSSKVPDKPITQTVNAPSAILPTPKEETRFRFKGISFSLPIAERLPSRNVSYTPAEILTVGELHQYLYRTDTTPANDFKDLQSVRITGTLVSVSASSSDEKDGLNGDLYASGTFLLIGDPLEKNRLPTKPLPPNQQPSISQGNTNSIVPRTVTKPRPMSILRNKHTPIVRMAQPTQTSNADGKPIATPAVAKESTQPVTTIMKKPILRGGLLNNNKPKKFVYAGNKSRSSLGGGLHRKFVTPKRGATMAAPNTTNTTGRVTSSLMRKRPLSLVKSVSVSSGRKNVKIETVIQSHPAPLVPVWIGSSLDDDGLGGSVVNDLVMVMGEIVVEHCSRCRERNENGSVTADADEEPTSVDDNEDVGHGAEKDDSPSSEEDKQQATAVKNVRDAALSIAATISNSAKPTSESAKRRPFCSHCACFLSARIVKNANGTDMNLQKQSLKVRREYFIKRKKQMEGLMQGMVTNPTIYSVGCGPFVNNKATVGSN
ncbi:hypothetical protein QTG54_013182 [Skeletonema marinoi]|uniref:Uncharacterized protein n=1 Tax=Skeletonema marinoi TaxID=267567 RepID=A0AAD9D6K5_9STRA|nr:hypothetical protein QTG54_013182 [Skeletonema marinoi]